MKQVWKWVMHLNAKVFCLIAALLTVATVGWCMYLYMTPLEPIKDGTGKLPDPPDAWTIGILDFVSAELAGEDLSIPVDPFDWTIDQIHANPEAWKAHQQNKNNPQGGGNKGGGNKQDPFAGLLGNKGGGGGAPGGGPQMVTPKISFNGFVRRSDGSMAAQFSDSSDNSTVFFSPGKTVHGLEIISADMKEAQVRYPDGSVGTIPIRGTVELAPEPAKEAAPQPAAAAKPAAAPKKPAPPKAKG